MVAEADNSQWEAFQTEMDTLAELALGVFREKTITPERLITWRTDCVKEALDAGGLPTTSDYVEALTEAVKAKGGHKLITLEELAPDETVVNATMEGVRTTVLPLYEGTCTGAEGWKPVEASSNYYRSLAEAILVEQDLPLHPELVEQVYGEIIKRRTAVGVTLRKIAIDHKRTGDKNRVRPLMVRALTDARFGDDGDLHDETMIVINKFIDKPRGKKTRRKPKPHDSIF
jgi:hypothetical protein